jgi:hypothetical protein
VSIRDPKLHSLAVTGAPHPVTQEEVAQHIRVLFDEAAFDVGENLAVFANAGVDLARSGDT